MDMIKRLWGDFNKWIKNDPDRRCYTCGQQPVGHYNDGSPMYTCRHQPIKSR